MEKTSVTLSNGMKIYSLATEAGLREFLRDEGEKFEHCVIENLEIEMGPEWTETITTIYKDGLTEHEAFTLCQELNETAKPEPENLIIARDFGWGITEELKNIS